MPLQVFTTLLLPSFPPPSSLLFSPILMLWVTGESELSGINPSAIISSILPPLLFLSLSLSPKPQPFGRLARSGWNRIDDLLSLPSPLFPFPSPSTSSLHSPFLLLTSPQLWSILDVIRVVREVRAALPGSLLVSHCHWSVPTRLDYLHCMSPFTPFLLSFYSLFIFLFIYFY